MIMSHLVYRNNTEYNWDDSFRKWFDYILHKWTTIHLRNVLLANLQNGKKKKKKTRLINCAHIQVIKFSSSSSSWFCPFLFFLLSVYRWNVFLWSSISVNHLKCNKTEVNWINNHNKTEINLQRFAHFARLYMEPMIGIGAATTTTTTTAAHAEFWYWKILRVN